MSKCVLLLVDIQNDFLPGGSLAVPCGDEVISAANRLIPGFDLVVATQDWHPPNHGSFASQHNGQEVGDTVVLGDLQQVLWPDHCVQGTHGAEFAPELNASGIDHVVRKGTDPMIDSYSGFFDNGHRRSTGLSDLLTASDVGRVTVAGLATDYCVRFTAMDALELGFETVLIEDGCRGVDLNPHDSQKAIAAMASAGVSVCSSSDVSCRNS